MMQREAAPARGQWIPWLLVPFFGIVFSVNAVMVWIAITTWTGLETTGAYRLGIDYNRTLEAAKAQAALGWQVDLALARAAPGRALVELSLADREGEAIGAAAVTAAFVRPTHAGHDRKVALPHGGEGHYRAEVELPLPGQWDVRLEARNGTKVYRLHERFFLAP
jgi:nitrogen fixation protein FixH